MKKYDYIILGFGKAGKTFAAFSAKKGKSVALVEASNKMYGGTCINIGCIPSKKLEIMSRNTINKTELNYKNAVEQKNQLIEKLRNKNFNLVKNAGVDIYDGVGSFKDNHTITINSTTGIQEIYGEIIIINTGAKTVIPNIPNIDKLNYTLSTTMLDETELPKELIIVGGGYIGLEFASIYSDFGAKVSVIEEQNSILYREDNDVAARVKEVLEEQGIKFYLGGKIKTITQKDNLTTILFEKGESLIEITGDKLLLATGRVPNTELLNLDNAGVKTGPRGGIIVNEYLKTSQDNIYAVGDVTGGLQFTYVSLDDFRILKEYFFGNNKKTTLNRKNIPYSLFIKPNYSRVGLSEKEALEKGYNIKVAKLETVNIPRAHIISQTSGFLKAIIDADTNKILGAALLCPNSTEMINFISLAINSNLDYTIIRDFIFTHPTMSESLNDLFNI